jgi:hypothetical protein
LKKIIFQILIIGILGIEIGFSQSETPFYEQIAFDFYRTEILPENPESKKIKIYKKLLTFPEAKTFFWVPRCITDFEITKTTKLKFNLSKKSKLNLVGLNDKIFKIKKYGKGAYPKLYVSESISNKQNRIIVNIHILYKSSNHNYRIELNKYGKIITWCEEGEIY